MLSGKIFSPGSDQNIQNSNPTGHITIEDGEHISIRQGPAPLVNITVDEQPSQQELSDTT
jgi:hypothetical protein